MPKFKFIAIDGDGKERRGMVEAPSRSLATTQLKSYGLLPAKVTAVKLAKSSLAVSSGSSDKMKAMKKPMYFGSAVNKKLLAEFTRKLATLLQAGLTLLRSLEVLMEQERDVVFKWILFEVTESIRSGNTFSESLSKFPKEFDFLYMNMARSGEASGMLELSLARLATYLEKTQRMKSRLKSALTYPAVVMTLASIIVMGLLVFVVPSFEKIFTEELGGKAMPVLTQYVLKVSDFFVHYWYFVIGIVFGFYILKKFIGNTEQGRRFYDWLKLNVAGIGDLTVKIQVIRFSRTLGTLIESSVPILEALRITRDACGNVHVMDAVQKVRNKVKDGEDIAATLSKTRIFPPMVSSMIEVGEQTGDLPEMLTQIADVYDEEVDNAIATLTSLVQPLMIVVMAIAVVTIVLALFLPFISIMESFA